MSEKEKKRLSCQGQHKGKLVYSTLLLSGANTAEKMQEQIKLFQPYNARELT